jgi:tRNA threonylcarbamoyladenosine biosynthesis protein TsaE
LSAETAILDLVSRGPADTRQIGRALGRLLKAGDVLLLEGRFGAGKTVLTQGIALGLGVEGIVNSPSFTLVNEYRAGKPHAGIPIYHADLYRIESIDEALALGLDEYLAGRGIFIAEWPENVAEVWPEERLWVVISVAQGKQSQNLRTIHIDAQGRRYVEIVDQLGRMLNT